MRSRKYGQKYSYIKKCLTEKENTDTNAEQVHDSVQEISFLFSICSEI